MTDREERRRARRYPKPGLIWYHVLPSESGGQIEGVASSFDVSRTGVGFITGDPLPLGALVFVHLRSRDIELTGLMRVARVRSAGPDRWEIGVEFELLPPDHRALLDRLFR